MALTPEQKNKFERDGFLVYGSILEEDELQTLSDRTDAIASGEKEIAGGYIKLEAAAQRGELDDVKPIDRVWQIHDAFRSDDVIMATCSNPRILDVVEELLGPNLKLFSDQTLMKPARHGSKIEFHQDSIYWPIEPYELVSCWLAMDDTTIENGCMELIPGSHRWGIIPHRGDRRLSIDEKTSASAVPAEVPAGGCCFHHSLTLHRSQSNQSARRRRAISMTYMRAESTYMKDSEDSDYPLLRGREFAGCI